MTGLNRTSVGLKRGCLALLLRSGECLNRTSVGLKRIPIPEGDGEVGSPQSNQRGIETALARGLPRRGGCASIEPAWD